MKVFAVEITNSLKFWNSLKHTHLGLYTVAHFIVILKYLGIIMLYIIWDIWNWFYVPLATFVVDMNYSKQYYQHETCIAMLYKLSRYKFSDIKVEFILVYILSKGACTVIIWWIVRKALVLINFRKKCMVCDLSS